MVIQVNSEWLFCFPKRDEVAERLLRTEVPILNALGSFLPLPVPQFEFVASAPGGEILPFGGYRKLPGERLADQLPELFQAHWWQPPVGAFLAALHSFPVAQARELGVRPMVMTRDRVANEEWHTVLEDFYTIIRYAVYPLLDEASQDIIATDLEEFLDARAIFSISAQPHTRRFQP